MRTSFLGVSLDILPLAEVEAAAKRSVESRQSVVHCSLNALKVVEARKDDKIKKLLDGFDLITPDGKSVVWGLRILGQGKAEQVAGVELMARLLQIGAAKKWRFFLLGAQPEVAATLRQRIGDTYPGAQVVGVQHGYFTPQEEGAVVERIRMSGPDVLFVGMPSPRKEIFLIKHRDAMKVPFSMGVGGGLDILAGRTRRAPDWMQRAGLEWSYRVIQEPRRLAGRYLSTNVRFGGILLGELLAGRRSRRPASC